MKENLKILIADDNELMQVLMRSFFIKYLVNPQIMQSANLEDTYSLLNAERFDLLLLDINMPNGDSSPQTVRILKDKYPHLKVAMFTANDKKTLETAYLAAGAIEFIQKNDHLNKSIKEFIDTKL